MLRFKNATEKAKYYLNENKLFPMLISDTQEKYIVEGISGNYVVIYNLQKNKFVCSCKNIREINCSHKIAAQMYRTDTKEIEYPIQTIRNRNLRLIDRTFKININEIKQNKAAGTKHEQIKEKICNDFLNKKEWFVTDCVFKKINDKQGKADVFNLDTSTIYEIINSESESRFNNKINYYPKAIIKKIYVKEKEEI